MTFDEWLVREHGLNHGWTFAEVDAARKAWSASAMIEREACAKACEDVDLHSGDHLKNSDPRMTCAAAIRAR